MKYWPDSYLLIVHFRLSLFLLLNFVLDLRKLCFLSKQRCHSISVHNVFYDIFAFSEFNRLCIMCVDSLMDILLHQSGTFFTIWLFDCCIDCIVFHLVCLSLHIIV